MDHSPIGLLAGRFVRARVGGHGNYDACRGFIAATDWDAGTCVTVERAIQAIATDDLLAAPVRASFLSLVKQSSVVGRLLSTGQLHVIPERTPMLRQSAGAIASWIPEGHAIPTSRGSWTHLPPLSARTLGAIAVQTKESVVRCAGSETAIIRDVATALAEAVDQAFFGLHHVGNPDAPDSVTADAGSAATVSATGDATADLADLFASFPGDPERAVFVCSNTAAVRLASVLPPAMVSLAPGARHLCGRGLYLTNATDDVSSGSTGENVVMLDPSRVEILEFGDAQIDVTHEGDVFMDANPTADATTGTASTLTSMFQTDSVGIRGTLRTGWRSHDAAAVLVGVEAYGAQP